MVCVLISEGFMSNRVILLFDIVGEAFPFWENEAPEKKTHLCCANSTLCWDSAVNSIKWVLTYLLHRVVL